MDHPSAGFLNSYQINLTTLSVAGAGGAKSSAAWDPGSVAAGQSVSTTVTVTGAALGDHVTAAFSLALGGLVLTAAVDSADTVRVTLSNPTSAAIDLASGTLTVLAFRVR